MAITTVPVSITVALITGQPLPRGIVVFRLTKPDVENGIVVPSMVTATLDDNGQGTANAFANAAGSQGSQTEVSISDEFGTRYFTGIATIPATACNLHQVLNTAAPPSSIIYPPTVPTAGQLLVGTAAGVYEARLLSGAVSDALLLGWAYAQAFGVTSATRNSDGAITTASIVWPDGVTGTYTADTLSTDFPGATDAWHATYAGTPVKTVTQAALTRNSDGAVTAQPAITIA